MQGSIICNFFTPISILPLYAVYFILIYCFYDFDFTCGLESLSEYSKELLSNAYKPLVTNLSYFDMLSFFCFLFHC